MDSRSNRRIDARIKQNHCRDRRQRGDGAGETVCIRNFFDSDIDESMLLAIANKIYKPSYISFETALSYYRLIPESIYMITSAATRRTSLFETPMARFSYRSIKPSLFFGYSLLTGGIKMAFMEKAVMDYLYLNPAVRTAADFDSLRINREEMLSRVSMERLTEYVQRFNHKRLSKTMKHFVYSKKEVERVRMFPDFVRQAI